jgi:hypothetical protein
MKRAVPAVMVVLLGFLVTSGLRAAAVEEVQWITDFEGAHCRQRSHEIVAPPLYGYEAFYGGEGNASTASCSCVPAPQEPQTYSQVVKLEYNVTRSRTYSGFWLKWSVPGFQIDDWDVLSFDIRGCDSSCEGDCEAFPVEPPYFSSTIKVELKVDGWGWRTVYIDNVTSEWTRLEIPLEWFEDTTWGYSGSRNEFVITLEEHVATVDRGVYYIDNIAFKRQGED